MKLGIQLYTVRDLSGDGMFKETLQTLADLGFEGVEFAWQYGGMDPSELANFLKSAGLECCGMHVQLDELLNAEHLVYKYAMAMQAAYITTSLASRVSEWDALIPLVEQAGRVAATKGLQFTYHNHHQELVRVGGEYELDRLFSQTSPEFVKCELDIGWIKKGGGDPMAHIAKYAGRLPQIHFRDYDDRRDSVCDVGEGFINASSVRSAGESAGTEWLVFEQDVYPVSALTSCEVCVARCREAGIL
ncbi:MAG: TIM barrel protein [Lentisphaeria bacterium]|nr:TIM barrel protein [Lentisphaeria bacterium]